MRVAILALQGAFIEHEKMLARLGVETFEVRQLRDWEQPKDGLIIPGGESTVQIKLLRDLGLYAPVAEAIKSGSPVFGTCAGLIMLAKTQDGEPANRLSTMDIDVRRNAYGRQLGSFMAEEDVGEFRAFPCVFIRAPLIEKVGEGVEVLSRHEGEITAVRWKNQLAMTFHPELTEDRRLHEMFLSIIEERGI